MSAQGGSTGAPADSNDESELRKQASVYGAAAFVGGYLVTYLLEGSNLERTVREEGLFGRGSLTPEAISNNGGTPPETFDMVGWLYHSLHQVDPELTIQPEESVSVSLALPEPEILIFVPPLMLMIAGYLVVSKTGPTDDSTAIRRGAHIVIGYCALTVLSAYLLSWSTTLTGFGNNITIEVTVPLVKSAVVGGILYPLVFGAVGGYVAYEQRDTAPVESSSAGPDAGPTVAAGEDADDTDAGDHKFNSEPEPSGESTGDRADHNSRTSDSQRSE